MKIYFDGASWTYGGGLDEEGHSLDCRFSKLVSDHYGAEEFNISEGGAAANTVLRHLFTGKYRQLEFDVKDFDAFVIELPFFQREEYYSEPANAWRRHKPDWALSKKYLNLKDKIYRFTIRSFIAELGKPLVLIYSSPQIYSMDYDLFFSKGFKYARLSKGHPNPLGHRQIADDIIKILTPRL